MAVDQRRRLQSQAEAALSAAESEKREAWQAIDRVTAELDRTRERADRADYELGSLKIPSRSLDETQELLKASRPAESEGTHQADTFCVPPHEHQHLYNFTSCCSSKLRSVDELELSRLSLLLCRS